MIDTKELRRLAQEATPGPWYIGSGIYEGRNIYSVEAVTDDEGFTYNPVVATAEDDEVACWDANARLIAAANPAVISELLDRLEAAEADALEQARLNGMGSEREAALMAKLEAAEKERDALRAKITEMERQEIGFRERCTPSSPTGYSNRFPRYALPGARSQPAPSVREGWKLVPIEPTEDMLRAMTDPFVAINGDNRKAFESAYTAMLAAAPKPEATP